MLRNLINSLVVVLIHAQIFSQFTIEMQRLNYNAFITLDTCRIEINPFRDDTIHSRQYSFQNCFGDSISLSRIDENDFYFIEYNSNNKLNRYGLLRYTKPKLDDYNLSDSIVLHFMVNNLDEASPLLPHGEWFYHLNDTAYLLINYFDGKRHGIFQQCIKSADSSKLVHEKYYIYDEEIQFDMNNPRDCADFNEKSLLEQLESNLFGTWFHYNWIQNRRFYTYLSKDRESQSYIGIVESTFLPDGNYYGIQYFMCGVGRKPDDKFIRSHWGLNKNASIFIHHTEFMIKSISDNHVLLMLVD